MDTMSSQEDAYLTPPDPKPECAVCGAKMKNGYCPNCDAPDYNPDDRID